MKIFGKQIEKTITHRFQGGWIKRGFVQHPVDTRTTSQINDNLEIYAKQIPEIQKFSTEIKNLLPEQKTLISDIIERAVAKPMLGIDIKYKETGLLEKTILDVIEAAKINPESLSFLQTILNNTDMLSAKYSISQITKQLKNREIKEQFKAAKELVPQIAEQTLNGNYMASLKNEQTFVNFLNTLLTPQAKPEKIKLFKDVQKVADKLDNANPIYLDDFVQSETPIEKIKDNLKTLPEVANVFKTKNKELNTTEYLIKNTNLY